MSDAIRRGSLSAPPAEPGAARAVAGRDVAALRGLSDAELRCAFLISYATDGDMELAARRTRELANAAIHCAEAIDRHRGKGQQTVRVEHVTVNAGGRAIVGAVSHPGRGDETENEHQPHASGDRGADRGAAMRGQDPERGPVPAGGGAGQGPVPDA